MIGYHYTTWKAYERICLEGLHLSLLEERHKDGCQEVLPYVGDGCIWVYTDFMRGHKLIGMVMYVACRHESDRIVCLEVEYPDVYSATWLASAAMAQRFEDDTSIRLSHDLDFSVIARAPITMFGHFKQSFDLITQPVQSKDVYLAGDWSLTEFVEAGILGIGERMVA